MQLSDTFIFYSCQIFDNTFSYDGKLRRHVATVNEKKRAFECKNCELSFSQIHHMSFYIATVHEGKKFKCELWY